MFRKQRLFSSEPAPPTLAELKFEITQQPLLQTMWTLQMCIHSSPDVSRVWKLVQDVYTEACDECGPGVFGEDLSEAWARPPEASAALLSVNHGLPQLICLCCRLRLLNAAIGLKKLEVWLWRFSASWVCWREVILFLFVSKALSSASFPKHAADTTYGLYLNI